MKYCKMLATTALIVIGLGIANGQVKRPDKETILKMVRSPIIQNANNWRPPPPYVGNTPPLIATLTNAVTVGAWGRDDLEKKLNKVVERNEAFEAYTADAVDRKLSEVDQCIVQNEVSSAAQVKDLERRVTTLIVSTSKTVPWAVYDDLRRELMAEAEKKFQAQIEPLRSEIAALRQEIASLKRTSTESDTPH